MPTIETVIADLGTVAGDRVNDVTTTVLIVTQEDFPLARMLLMKSPLGVFVRQDGSARRFLPNQTVGPKGTVVMPSRELNVNGVGVIVHELAHAWCASCPAVNPGAAGGPEDERLARLFEMDWLARLCNSQTETGEYLRANLEQYITGRIAEWKLSPGNKDYFIFMLNRCGVGQLSHLWP